MRVIERRGGHYDVSELAFGRDYVWRPGCVVVECDCGRRGVYTLSNAVCGCGLDLSGVVREELLGRGRTEEAELHPWEREYQEWLDRGRGMLRSERYDWEEWKAI